MCENLSKGSTSTTYTPEKCLNFFDTRKTLVDITANAHLVKIYSMGTLELEIHTYQKDYFKKVVDFCDGNVDDFFSGNSVAFFGGNIVDFFGENIVDFFGGNIVDFFGRNIIDFFGGNIVDFFEKKIEK